MAEKLKKSKIESYEKELEKRKIELRNIQMQIQPHFLLNTFNLINNLAVKNEGRAIQDVITYLSDYFRYTFRSNKELDLYGKEQRMIEEYIQVMNIRYPGRIQLYFMIDPEICFVRIPPMLLHNFIENSIKHGMKANQVLHITLNGEWNEECVIFEIIDDGNGMDPKTLTQVQKMISGEQKMDEINAHTGFINSIKRLKYYYGETAKLNVYSEKGQMTVVTIEFPYNTGAENDTFNCE